MGDGDFGDRHEHIRECCLARRGVQVYARRVNSVACRARFQMGRQGLQSREREAAVRAGREGQAGSPFHDLHARGRAARDVNLAPVNEPAVASDADVRPQVHLQAASRNPRAPEVLHVAAVGRDRAARAVAHCHLVEAALYLEARKVRPDSHSVARAVHRYCRARTAGVRMRRFPRAGHRLTGGEVRRAPDYRRGSRAGYAQHRRFAGQNGYVRRKRAECPVRLRCCYRVHAGGRKKRESAVPAGFCGERVRPVRRRYRDAGNIRTER